MGTHGYYSAGSSQYAGAGSNGSYGNGFATTATAPALAQTSSHSGPNGHASTSYYYGQSSSSSAPSSHALPSLNGYSSQAPQHATSHHASYGHAMSAPSVANNGIYAHPSYPANSAPAPHGYSPYGTNPYGGLDHGGMLGLPMGHPSHAAANGLAQMAIRPKRKQVKNACINCQKACKKCDEGRPCSRCVKYGLTDSCQDSSRKERKRGVKRGPYKRRGLTSDQASASNDGSVSASASHSAPEDTATGSRRSNGGVEHGSSISISSSSNRQFFSRSPYSAASDSNTSTSAFESALTPAGLHAPNRFSSAASSTSQNGYEQSPQQQHQQQQPLLSQQQQQQQMPRRFEDGRLNTSSSSSSSSLGLGNNNYYPSMQNSNTLPALNSVPSAGQNFGGNSNSNGHYRFHSDSLSTTPASSLGPHTPMGSSNGSLADGGAHASILNQSPSAYANYAKPSSSSSSSSSSGLATLSSSYNHQTAGSGFLQPMMNGSSNSSGGLNSFSGATSSLMNPTSGGRREGSAPTSNYATSSTPSAFVQLRPSFGGASHRGASLYRDEASSAEQAQQQHQQQQQQQQQQQHQLSSPMDYNAPSSSSHHGGQHHHASSSPQYGGMTPHAHSHGHAQGHSHHGHAHHGHGHGHGHSSDPMRSAAVMSAMPRMVGSDDLVGLSAA